MCNYSFTVELTFLQFIIFINEVVFISEKDNMNFSTSYNEHYSFYTMVKIEWFSDCYFFSIL